MTTIWTPANEHAFHTLSFRLAKLSQTPDEDVNYREQEVRKPIQADHTLRFSDEMQLADHMALLCHTAEGFAAISATCVEEQPDKSGLVIRIARNYLRGTKELEGLRNILDILQSFARRGTYGYNARGGSDVANF